MKTLVTIALILELERSGIATALTVAVAPVVVACGDVVFCRKKREVEISACSVLNSQLAEGLFPSRDRSRGQNIYLS